jgi:branched-chain amino acid transport system ATP-binding protein
MSLFAVSNLSARYGILPILKDLSFVLDAGTCTLVLGANGAGKSTLMKALSGIVATTGSISLDSRPLHDISPARRVKLGVIHIPEGRHVFKDLTVIENLRAGAYLRRDRAAVNDDVSRWLEMFPKLAHRSKTAAGNLSGGEQQMLAVARGMMGRPRVLLLDEPSLGLAPNLVDELFMVLNAIRASDGLTMLVAEQDVKAASQLGDRALVMMDGEILKQYDDLQVMTADPLFRTAYLGEAVA